MGGRGRDAAHMARARAKRATHLEAVFWEGWNSDASSAPTCWSPMLVNSTQETNPPPASATVHARWPF